MNMETEDELNTVVGFDALYESMNKCRKGVIWKDSVASFVLNDLERVIKLSRDLEDGTYKAQKPITFTLMSPKRREISSIGFRDRVYQRSLNDNAVYPIMSKSFIYDNYACQKGKGTDAARNRLKEFLYKYYRKYGSRGYVAQFDIRGYYPNMSHAITDELFKEKLPVSVYLLVQRILNEQYVGDHGYNPGSQLVQIVGISVLDKFDHFVKEVLRAKYYLRYMDDFLIISCDREYLDACVAEIQKELQKLEFELNSDKTKISSLENGIDFLGFHYNLTDTGKVVLTVKSSNVKNERRKLRRLVSKSKKGFLPKEKVDESYASWRNHASKGNSYNLLKKMDEYYKSLWR